MIRFLHAADLHLDSPLKGLERYEGAPVDRLRLASRDALANLVNFAIERKVDFVLLAGDIYDGDWHDTGTGFYFVGQMSRLYDAKIPVYLLAGNHDAANRMSRQLKYPDNVHTFSHERPETFTLDHVGVALHGQGYAEQAEPNNLALTYPGAFKGLLNIGVLHTALTGREGHERYAPCMVEDLLTRNFDYWALGHVHQRESVREGNHPRVEFSGNLQGRHIRETGAKGCLLATSNGSGKIAVEFEPLDVLRWQRVVVECDGVTRFDDVLANVKAKLTDAAAGAKGRLLAVRIEIVGACPCHDSLLARAAALRDNVRAIARPIAEGSIWIEKIAVHTKRPETATSVRISDDALSEIAAVASDLAARPESLQEILDLDPFKTLASRLPPELSEGDAAMLLRNPDWARGLLDRARAILISKANAKEADE